MILAAAQQATGICHTLPFGLPAKGRDAEPGRHIQETLARGVIGAENASRLRGLLVLSDQATVDVGPDLIGVVGCVLAEYQDPFENRSLRQGKGTTDAHCRDSLR